LIPHADARVVCASHGHVRDTRQAIVCAMTTATEMLAQYIAAETAVLSGQRFRMGERELTRADLAEIRAGRREWAQTVAAETAAAANAGRGDPRVAFADFGGEA
jgi:hypothetical protein